MTRHPIVLGLSAVTLALGTAVSAEAHVTLQPATAPAGAYVVERVRVPNERDDAATTRVAVQLPPGFEFASYEPVAGWKTEVRRRGEEVGQVVFTASGGGITPGTFRDFPLSLKMPETPGRTLTFKATQTYEGGEVVRWIGAPDDDEPAPTIELTAAEPEAEPTAAPAPAVAAATGDGGEDDGNGLAIAALAVGGLGLAVGAAGLTTARRRPAAA